MIGIWFPLSGLAWWDMTTSNLYKIIVKAELTDIPLEVRGDYIESSQQRKTVQKWVNGLWYAKDAKLAELRSEESN